MLVSKVAKIELLGLSWLQEGLCRLEVLMNTKLQPLAQDHQPTSS
jgi:23S rRNA C2498 (ribose-2'-O)-methylase RlmM